MGRRKTGPCPLLTNKVPIRGKATRFSGLSNRYISIPFCRKAALIEALKLYSVLAGGALATLSSGRKESEQTNVGLWEADCCPLWTTFLQHPSSRRLSPIMRNKSITQAARTRRHPTANASARVDTNHLDRVQRRHWASTPLLQHPAWMFNPAIFVSWPSLLPFKPLLMFSQTWKLMISTTGPAGWC